MSKLWTTFGEEKKMVCLNFGLVVIVFIMLNFTGKENKFLKIQTVSKLRTIPTISLLIPSGIIYALRNEQKKKEKKMNDRMGSIAQ